MKVKKIPMRKCVACGENKPKKDLLRIVNNKEEGIIVDPTGKKNGRGAYICKDISCLELAKKSNRINHALNAEINEEVYKEIADYVTNSK
ncbi:RNase P modulator RnpM [Miniphocaeibacter massiliensis]|uniref:RNase P modulator RnpM n=1 Tax=Miniphocaeibacter massiliensis TaxID=2041841 RepID=UPI000C06DE89|nr:YlxR family protein [Miniphocaeibacter massiliensis]